MQQFVGKNGVQKLIKDALLTVEGDAVRANSDAQWTSGLTVPPTAFPSLLDCSVIKCQYTAVVRDFSIWAVTLSRDGCGNLIRQDSKCCSRLMKRWCNSVAAVKVTAGLPALRQSILAAGVVVSSVLLQHQEDLSYEMRSVLRISRLPIRVSSTMGW